MLNIQDVKLWTKLFTLSDLWFSVHLSTILWRLIAHSGTALKHKHLDGDKQTAGMLVSSFRYGLLGQHMVIGMLFTWLLSTAEVLLGYTDSTSIYVLVDSSGDALKQNLYHHLDTPRRELEVSRFVQLRSIATREVQDGFWCTSA